MKRYLSTKNIAEMYDVSYDFFRNRMDDTFQRGVHYIQHDKQCPIRWDIEAIEQWWNGTNKTAHDELVERLLQL